MKSTVAQNEISLNKSMSLAVSKTMLRNLGSAALIYLCVVICMGITIAIISNIAVLEIAEEDVADIFIAIPQFTAIFMLVVGIVFPLVYQKYFTSMGVNRKQQTQGTLIAVVVCAFGFTLIHLVAYLLLNALGCISLEFGTLPLRLLSDFIQFNCFYFIGWLIAWGFGYGRIISAVPCLLVGIVLVNQTSWFMNSTKIWNTTFSSFAPTWLGPSLVAIICVLLIVVLFALMKRLPFKAS